MLIYYVAYLKKLSVTHITYVEWWDDSEKLIRSNVKWSDGAEFEVLALKIWGIIPKFDKKIKENHKKLIGQCCSQDSNLAACQY